MNEVIESAIMANNEENCDLNTTNTNIDILLKAGEFNDSDNSLIYYVF